MNSLKQEIINRVKREYPEWVHKGTLERLALELGYDAENGARRARELSQKIEGKEAILHKQENEKGNILYRYNPYWLIEKKPDVPHPIETPRTDVERPVLQELFAGK